MKVEEGTFPRTVLRPSGTWFKTGYTGDGEWYTRTDDNEYELFTFGSTRVNEDITLYLKWDIVSYDVKLTQGSGYTLTALSSVPVEYGNSFTFEFNLDEEYSESLYTVFVNAKPIDIADGGQYTIENVTRPITVSVSGVMPAPDISFSEERKRTIIPFIVPCIPVAAVLSTLLLMRFRK